jgi:hypothetical protein
MDLGVRKLLQLFLENSELLFGQGVSMLSFSIVTLLKYVVKVCPMANFGL